MSDDASLDDLPSRHFDLETHTDLIIELFEDGNTFDIITRLIMIAQDRAAQVTDGSGPLWDMLAKEIAQDSDPRLSTLINAFHTLRIRLVVVRNGEV